MTANLCQCYGKKLDILSKSFRNILVIMATMWRAKRVFALFLAVKWWMRSKMRRFWWGWDESVVPQGQGTFRECMNVADVCRERACPFRTPGRALLLFGSAAEGVVLLFFREKRSRKAGVRTAAVNRARAIAHHFLASRSLAEGSLPFLRSLWLTKASPQAIRVRVLIRPEKGRGICPRALLSPL